MAERDRKALICEQATLQVTGIDFVRVVDPEVQTRLEVFFLIDPDALDVDPFDLLSTPPAGFARIDAVNDDSTVAIAALSWDRVPDAQGALRTVLVVDTEEPGGFQIYRLTLVDDHAPSRIDPFFNAVEFSFKQGCPSDFDCKPRHDCPEEALVDWPVDYLARDFESLRNALLEFSAQRYPDWQERIPADAGAHDRRADGGARRRAQLRPGPLRPRGLSGNAEPAALARRVRAPGRLSARRGPEPTHLVAADGRDRGA